MPARPQRRRPPQERQVFGLTILHPSHPEVQRLQHDTARPGLHGHKVWPASFVLLNYLHQRGVAPQARVLELGCGWGLVGIACAKTFQAQVTGLDADAAVFPYLQLHARRNGVHLATRHGTFADLTPQDLAAFELIVGADICFWEELVDPLYQVVRRGVAAGVADILLADPGRPPFDELCARCLQHGDTEVLAWATTTPVRESGWILRVVGTAEAAVGRSPCGQPAEAPEAVMAAHRHDGARRTAWRCPPPEEAGGPLTGRPVSTLRSQTGRAMGQGTVALAAADSVGIDHARISCPAAASSCPGVDHAAPPAAPHGRVPRRALGGEDGA
jgi:predicted nicotinamide N-methyase